MVPREHVRIELTSVEFSIFFLPKSRGCLTAEPMGRVVSLCSMLPIFLKGVQCSEDAVLAYVAWKFVFCLLVMFFPGF